MAANNSLYKLETKLNCIENSATNGKPVVTGPLIMQRYTDWFLRVVCVNYEKWNRAQKHCDIKTLYLRI
jgi:hypothetical protein